MKNYYVYDRNRNHISSHNTEEEAIAATRKLAQEWTWMGRKGLTWEVCYNGKESEHIATIES